MSDTIHKAHVSVERLAKMLNIDLAYVKAKCLHVGNVQEGGDANANIRIYLKYEWYAVEEHIRSELKEMTLYF